MKQLVASAVLALSVLVCLCSSAQEGPAKETQQAASTSRQGEVLQASAGMPPATAPPAGTPEAMILPSAPRQQAILKPAAVVPMGVAESPEVPGRARLIDKKFVGLGVLVFGTTSLDMELTQHCLQRNTCIELNPTLPTSHWGMYATNTPVNAGVMWLAYKRRQGKHWDWWLWPAIDAGIHVYGVTTNARYAWGGR